MTRYEEEWEKIKVRYPQIHRYDRLLKSAIKGRVLLIWGASNKSDWFLRICRSAQIEVAGYIDNDPNLFSYQGLPVYRPDILRPNDYFVFVALENRYSEVLCQLKKNNMEEFEDYIYPLGDTIILKGCERGYLDLNGNEVSGIIDGYSVELSKGSKLVVGKNCRIDENTHIRLFQNAILVIGDGCTIGPQCSISISDSICTIGTNSIIGDAFSMILQTSSIVYMGEDCSYNHSFKLRAGKYTVCRIGKDCMFAEDVRLQCTDGHNYFDLKNKRNIGMQKKYRIHIGEHVWVGARSSLLYGTDIGAGCIVGLGSFVNKKFPANVILAGVPARILRRQTAWSRRGDVFIQNDDVFSPYDFSNKK